MADEFKYDVFLSHSSKDKAVVRPIAERMRADGLRVWFDEWVLKPGDSIPAKIEEGLERSRVFVLCMSASAFGSDWAQLEAGTFRFRDPLNKELRFIPLRLDDAPIKGSLEQFLYIDWHQEDCEREYVKLFDACCPPTQSVLLADAQLRFQNDLLMLGHTAGVNSVSWSPDGNLVLSGSNDVKVRLWDVNTGRLLRVLEGNTSVVFSLDWSLDGKCALSGSDDGRVRIWDVNTGHCLRVLEGHEDRVWCVSWSPDGQFALSGGWDKTVRFWDVDTGRCLRVLEGHTASVNSVSWSPDGQLAISGADDKTVRLWEVNSGNCLRVLEGHTAGVRNVSWSPDGQLALSGSRDNTVRLWEVNTGQCVRVLEDHSDWVNSVSWSPDGQLAISGADDKTVRLWEVNTGGCLRVLGCHTRSVNSVAWSPDDGRHVLSGADDKTARLWEINTGCCLRVLEGHTDDVNSVSWSPDGQLAISGADDKTVRLWEISTGRCLRVLEGHTRSVNSVAWSPDGQHAISGADDKIVRLWEISTGRCLRVLEGHTDDVRSVAWSPDGQYAISGADDKTVRLWEISTGRCLRVLEGHTDDVRSVAWSPDGQHAISGADDKIVRLWEISTGRCLRVLEGHSGVVHSVSWSPDGKLALSGALNGVMRVWDTEVDGSDENIQALESGFAPAGVVEELAQYTNAKVLLVGESGVGKTALSKRLASNEWKPSDSTVGAWATQWKLPVSVGDGVEREIWIWDFGGQADQRLIHQLYMDETALAVLVFDGQKEDLFETLGQWERDLTRSSRKAFTKLLAAGRVDAGGLRVSRSQIEAFAKERGYAGFLETSAKANICCEELKQAIIEGIHWENIPWRSSPLLFKRLKEEIIRFKDEGRVLMRFNELCDALRLRLSGEDGHFKEEELKAVVGLLSGPGVVWELAFGGWVLLQPERINAYAQAMIQTLREDPYERGCILEERVLAGDLAYHSSMHRLERAEEERIMLLAMHQILIERGLCLREHTSKGTMLIFPSYYRRERTELVGHPAVLVSYRFNGFLDDIYATLVVQLHHTNSFQQDQLWRYAADFKTLTGKQLGVKLTRRAEGAGEMDVYFDPSIPLEEKIIFSRYVHEHLLKKAQDFERYRHYICPHCGTPAGNPDVAMKKLSEGKKDILCVNCDDSDKRIPLWDQLEVLFASEATKDRVLELQEQSAIVLDTENKERILVGEVISTVALAGQISREFTVSDHGIDMEIEFKDDNYEATGQRLYLQLKSGDSYLRERKRDGAEIFTIQKERHTSYWMIQQFPVLLVIRNSEGEIRWMEVRDWLKRESGNGKKPVRQIVFEGERFDVMSVRRWRDRMLDASRP